MFSDALGVLCGLLVLAAIVAASPLVFRLLGSSWPVPKPERRRVQPAPCIRMFANEIEYAREKLGAVFVDKILDEVVGKTPLTACTDWSDCNTTSAPTLESVAAIMDRLKPDPMLNAPVVEVDGQAYKINPEFMRFRFGFEMPLLFEPRAIVRGSY